MTDQFSRDRSAKLTAFYQTFRTAFHATTVGGEFMKYRWWRLVSSTFDAKVPPLKRVGFAGGLLARDERKEAIDEVTRGVPCPQ